MFAITAITAPLKTVTSATGPAARQGLKYLGRSSVRRGLQSTARSGERYMSGSVARPMEPSVTRHIRSQQFFSTANASSRYMSTNQSEPMKKATSMWRGPLTHTEASNGVYGFLSAMLVATGFSTAYLFHRDNKVDCHWDEITPSPIGSSNINSPGTGLFDVRSMLRSMDRVIPQTEFVLQMEAALATSLFNAIAFESWGQRLMIACNKRPDIPLRTQIKDVVAEMTETPRRLGKILRGTAVEAAIHRGLVKYGPFWFVRDACKKVFDDENKFSHQVGRIVAPTGILAVAEAVIVTPASRPLYALNGDPLSKGYLAEGRDMVRTGGFRSLWRGGGGVAARTVGFGIGQHGGITFVEWCRNRYTPGFSDEHPTYALLEKSLVGSLAGVWFSMVPQIFFSRSTFPENAHKTPRQLIAEMFSNPRQLFAETFGSGFRAKLAFKGPNCVTMKVVPPILAGYLYQKLHSTPSGGCWE